MTTYLVTGATGFIGGALVRSLRKDGADVRALVRPETDASALEADGCRVLRATLSDPNAIAEAASGAQVLFHCAGESGHRASPSALSWIHVAGTENVIHAAEHAGVQRVVHLSCADVTLVNDDRKNVKESQTQARAPLDAWARTKLLAEELALHANRTAFEVCAVRPAWVWGPGDFHTLPALCLEAAAGGVRLCGSGTNFIPTTHVDNAVHALRLAAHSSKAPGHAYHVLDAELLSAREFLSQLCASLGLPAPRASSYALSYLSAMWCERFGAAGLCRADVARRGRTAVLDGVAAVRDLGYQPQTSVEAGMAALALWARSMGGPAALAERRRVPADDTQAHEWARLADAAG
jgi:2-alkyl-3-oxoalkanoate reductase